MALVVEKNEAFNPVDVGLLGTGLAESADDWRSTIEGLSPLAAAAVSLRGRGTSLCPVAGYSLLDHCSDIAAFVAYLPAQRVVLVAFSRSVAYALEYAVRQPRKLAGLVLLDYPPRHTAIRPGWAASFAESLWRGRTVSEVVNPSVLRAIESEAVAKDYASLLHSILVPTLVVRGGSSGAALSDSDAETYKANLPNCTVIEFANSAHALWEPEPEALISTIAKFTAQLQGET